VKKMPLKTMKMVQVPMSNELANDIIKIAKETGESRAEIIRKACQSYISYIKEKNMEEIYIDGYKKIPEDVNMAQVSSEIYANLASGEEW
jgi:metal-responsive CopG/Arc/MetJ family transcriptional regulator